MTLRLADTLPRTPPAEFRVFPAGAFETSKGTYKFDAEAAALVLAVWKERGNKLTIDYEHAALEPAGAIAEGAPCAGSFDLEVRNGELWAVNLRWTDRASGYLSAGEYLYFSPAFTHDAAGRVTRLVNIALTNLPATKRMDPLVAANDKEHAMDPEALKKLTDAMAGLSTGLAEHAKALTEHAKLLSKASDAPEPPAKKDDDDKPADEETKAARERIAALTGKASLSEGLGVLQGMKDSAAKLTEVQGELAALKASALESEVTALVDGAIRDGKITPAQKTQFIDQGKKDLAFLKGYIASAPKVTGGTAPVREPPPANGGEVATLTDVEKKQADSIGVTHDAFAKNKARRLKEQGATA